MCACDKHMFGTVYECVCTWQVYVWDSVCVSVCDRCMHKRMCGTVCVQGSAYESVCMCVEVCGGALGSLRI